MKESLLVSAIIKWLYAYGMQPVRNNTGAFSKTYTNKAGKAKTSFIRVGKKGSGDILVCTKGGKWCEIEAKSDTGHQQPEQIERQKHIESMGGIYILARSLDDLEKRKHELTERKNQ